MLFPKSVNHVVCMNLISPYHATPEQNEFTDHNGRSSFPKEDMNRKMCMCVDELINFYFI